MLPLSSPTNNGPFTKINPMIPTWLKQPSDGVPDYATGTFGKWHLGLDEVYTNYGNRKTEPTTYTIGGLGGYGLPTNGPTSTSSPGTGSPWHPLNRGFDTCFNFMERGSHDYWDPNGIYINYARSGGLDPRINPGSQVGDQDPLTSWDTGYFINTNRTPANYLTNRITDAACNFIEANARAGKPLFCYVPFNAAHDPLQAPYHFNTATGGLEVLGTTNGQRYATSSPDWFPDPLWYYETYPNMAIPSYLAPQTPAEADAMRRTRSITLAQVYWIDKSVGRIIQKLRDEGVHGNTIVVFFSDNGGAPGQRATNTPLRQHKDTNYEGGIRVPFCFSWPALFDSLPTGQKGGRVISEPVTSLDILPTVAEAAGVTLPVSPPGFNYTPDGKSWLPLIAGTTANIHDYLYWSEGSSGRTAVRMGRWKLYIEGAKYELFDLDADVSESTNLAAQNPDMVRHLRQKYYAWLVDVAASAGLSPQTWTTSSTPGDPGFSNLITDPLNYPANAPLGTQAGGSGWAGGWTSANVQVLPGSPTFANPLYTGGTDNTHVARILSIASAAAGTATRTLPAQAGTVWMSFLTTYAGPNTSGASTGPNNNHETSLVLNGDETNGIRIYGGNNNNAAGIFKLGLKVADVTPDTDVPTNATTVLHLVKIESNVEDDADRLTWYWTTDPAALTSRTTATLANFKKLTYQSTDDWWGSALSSIGLLWKNSTNATTSGGLNDRAFDNLRISYGLSDDGMIEAVLSGVTDTAVPSQAAFSLQKHGLSVADAGRFVLEYDLKRNWIPGGPRFRFSQTLAPGSWQQVTPTVVRQLDAFGDTDTFTAEFPITTPRGFYQITD